MILAVNLYREDDKFRWPFRMLSRDTCCVRRRKPLALALVTRYERNLGGLTMPRPTGENDSESDQGGEDRHDLEEARIADEQALLASALDGDVQAQMRLFMPYYDKLSALIASLMPDRLKGRVDPGEFVQIACMEAFRSLDRFEYKGVGSFEAWLKTIAKHRLVDEIRRVDRGPGHVRVNGSDSMADPLGQLQPQSETPSRVARHKEAKVVLRAAIDSLPNETWRKVLDMRFFQEMDWGQIAAHLGGSKSSARSLCHRAMKELKDKLGTFSNLMSRR